MEAETAETPRKRGSKKGKCKVKGKKKPADEDKGSLDSYFTKTKHPKKDTGKLTNTFGTLLVAVLY